VTVVLALGSCARLARRVRHLQRRPPAHSGWSIPTAIVQEWWSWSLLKMA